MVLEREESGKALESLEGTATAAEKIHFDGAHFRRDIATMVVWARASPLS